jgi:hypothetical protein
MLIAARSSQDFAPQANIPRLRAKNPHEIGTSRATVSQAVSAKRERKGTKSPRAAPKVTEKITECFAAFAGRSQRRGPP